MTHMTKTVSTSKKTRKQHSPEFCSEALKLAERIGVAAAARELSLYESQPLCVAQQTAATDDLV
ncbi:Transposase (plasmid) [Shigella dysenteriae WRSd5]|nr:Transposase [Shigella dysenteriae WRSd5]